MRVSLLQVYIVLSNHPEHQGKFHLLVIFSIPAILVALFLIQNWVVTTVILLLFGIACWWLFFRKKNS